MKQTLSLLSALLCLTLLFGCSPAEAPAAEPEPPVPAVEPEPARALRYHIERTELGEDLPAEMYFEIPVFEGDSDAARRINETLSAVRQAYIDGSAEDVRQMVRDSMGSEYGPTAETPYIDTHSASVFTCDASLVSVAISYAWYMGGVYDYGMDTYAFDGASGEPLYLSDLLGGTDDEIREGIVTALLEQYPGVEDAGVLETPMDAIRAKPIKDCHFYVDSGVVHVAFNKYEITYGAAGAFDVSLPDTLSR